MYGRPILELARQREAASSIEQRRNISPVDETHWVESVRPDRTATDSYAVVIGTAFGSARSGHPGKIRSEILVVDVLIGNYRYAMDHAKVSDGRCLKGRGQHRVGNT